MKLTLRTYAPEDFETIYELDQACYEAEVAYSRRELRNYLRFPGAECVVAEAGSEAVGFCLGAHQGTRGHIITMDVREPYRRKGVGSRLLSEVERRMAAGGVKEIGLETATDNRSAIAFWHKHGYRTRGVWKSYYPGGRDAFAMVKLLGESPLGPTRSGE